MYRNATIAHRSLKDCLNYETLPVHGTFTIGERTCIRACQLKVGDCVVWNEYFFRVISVVDDRFIIKLLYKHYTGKYSPASVVHSLGVNSKQIIQIKI